MKQKIRLLLNIFLYNLVFLLMVSGVHAASSINLGTADNFAILSKSGVTDVPSSSIIGDVGSSPITGAAIGISCTEVTGAIYDNNGLYTGGYDSNIICRVTDAGLLTTAVNDMEAAYTSASGQAPADFTGLGSGDISGYILTPGIYKWTTGLLINSGTPPDANGVTLDCGGDTNAVFIFQIAGTLTVGSSAVVTLSNGCQAKNIFWAVAGQTTLGTYSFFNGDILSGPGVGVDEAIALRTGATLCGRALSQKAVTLDQNYISLICGNMNESNLTTLAVIKRVINDDSGTAVVSDFTLLINSHSVISGTTYPIAPGAYVVSEIPALGYNGVITGDCAPDGTVNLTAGQNKICIITNNDAPLDINLSANLTVIKMVINDDGGTAVVSDFTLLVNGHSVISNTTYSVAPGTYVVSEVADPEYSATFSGDCSANGTVVLNASDAKTCTITNNDVHYKSIPVIDSKLLIVLTVFTLMLGLYGFKKDGR